jgi:hypothetical protein
VLQNTEPPPADLSEGEEDELQRAAGDQQQMAGAVIRTFIKEGWLETFGDRAGLVTAYRFTRAGKLFAQVLWELDRPRMRTRQRNMRSCRNSLQATLRTVDANDLIDAYEYAERVIGDLAEGSDYFQELVRRLTAEAARQPWDEFMEFLDRFEREFKTQLTADNVERHRHYIRDTLDKLQGIDDARYRSLEGQLNEVARWAYEQRTGDSTYHWLLSRIDELIEAACTQKLPELLKAMNNYMRRATTIVQQAFVLRGGQKKHAFARAIAHIASTQRDHQDTVLEKIGQRMAGVEIRLLDPQSFKLRTASTRRKALTVTSSPAVTRESRLEAWLARAEAAAFALSNDEVIMALRHEIKASSRPIRLSQLPLKSAAEVLLAMQAVEAIRANSDTGLVATRLATKIETPYYVGSDYEIEKTHVY